MEKVAYLGGPMRGLPYWNFPAFDAAARALREQGWTIFSPADHDRELGAEPPEDGTSDFTLLGACLDWDFARIAESSCVIVLPGWETSTGCHWEFTVAYALGKPVVEYPDMQPIEMPRVVKDPVGVRISEHAGRVHELTVAQSPLTDDTPIPAFDDHDGWRHLGEPPSVMRTFGTGATRHSDDDKLDYEGFLSPAALRLYAEYLHKHRRQADGNLRDSDNWQCGIPRDVYMKSAFRHFMAAWTAHRAGEDPTEDFCGVLFNVMGYLHEQDKSGAADA